MNDPLSTSEVELKTARSRFSNSLSSVKARISPKALKDDALNTAKNRLIGVALASLRSPVIAVSALAVAGLIAFRKPISAAVKRLSKEKKNV